MNKNISNTIITSGTKLGAIGQKTNVSPIWGDIWLLDIIIACVPLETTLTMVLLPSAAADLHKTMAKTVSKLKQLHSLSFN